MRRQILVLLGAAAFTFGTAANAAVTVDDTSFEATDGPDTTGTTTTIGYTDTDLDNPSFSEFLTFTNDLAGVYSLTLSTSSLSVDFTSAILTLTSDGSTVATLTSGFDNGTTEFWQVSDVNLGSGQYTLTITGDNNDTGALEGSITINANAVPEPATWAMMLLGFGAVGFSMRRRRRPALVQIA